MEGYRVIFELSGRQFTAKIGDKVVVPHFPFLALGEDITTKGLLAFREESNEIVAVNNGSFNITLRAEEFFLGPKVLFFKKHRRNNRYKRKGHRAHLAVVQVKEATF